MGIVFKNNAKTTLASSLSNSATSATVADGAVFPSLSAGEHFLITFDDGSNNEICKCTARSGNTLTIVRAQESTTARAFSSGDAAEGRLTAGVLETIQENIAAKSANQTVFNATTSGNATTYNIGVNPGVEANAMVFLNGVLQHHDTISFSGVNLTFDAAPPNGMALEVIVDNLINLQSSNLTVDSFTAADVGGSAQTAFTLSDSPAAETNLIVFVEGVFQDQDAYTISSNTLTITTGVIAGRGVTVYIINPVNIGTPSDGTVTSAKLSGNITTPGTLTVGSHDVAFDSPTFVVDNSNSRVGLGTASPSVPVDIVGDVKMSANLTVDTTTLVVDSSNNRVGIGTNSPARALEINSGSSPIIESVASGSNNSSLRLRGSLSSGHYWDIQHVHSDNDLSFGWSGSEKVTFNDDGGVGIGHGGYSSTLLSLHNGTGRSTLIYGDSGDANCDISLRDNSSNVNVVYGATGNNHIFKKDSAEHMRIDSNGNLGLGDSSPANFSGYVVASLADSTGGIIDFKTTGSEGVFARIQGVVNNQLAINNKQAYPITFGTTDTERMRINANGKVSIGGTEDTYDLMIKRPTAASATSVVLQRVWNQNQGWQAEALTEYFTDLESTAYPRAQIGYYRGDTSDNDSSGFIVKTGLSSSGMATRFKVTATGMVEMPEQPAFMASLSSGQAITGTNTTIAFNSESFDRKNNHSNGVFTAPHAGVYLFGANFLVYPWTSGILNVGFYKDGSNYSPIVQSGPAAQSHTAVSHQCLIQCNKNDEITVRVSGSGFNAGANVYGSQAYWWGYMVG